MFWESAKKISVHFVYTVATFDERNDTKWYMMIFFDFILRILFIAS